MCCDGKNTYLQQDCYTLQKTCPRPGLWVAAKSRTETYAQLILVASINVGKTRRATLLPLLSILARNRQPVFQRRKWDAGEQSLDVAQLLLMRPAFKGCF
jgi:hypothetical protein